jgi:hypothetical protein
VAVVAVVAELALPIVQRLLSPIFFEPFFTLSR